MKMRFYCLSFNKVDLSFYFSYLTYKTFDVFLHKANIYLLEYITLLWGQDSMRLYIFQIDSTGTCTKFSSTKEK